MRRIEGRAGARMRGAKADGWNAGVAGFRLPVAAAAMAMLAAGLAGCDSDPVGTAPPGEGMVSVVFEAADESAASGATAAGLGSASEGRVVPGTNGTLVLETMHVTVDEVELDREDGGDDFELGPFFTEIPLAEGLAVELFHSPVPPGRYDEFELEIEEPDDDLLEEVREEVDPYWPSDASLRITGTFEPEDGAAQPFLAFLEAEIEVELEFEPFLHVTEDGSGRTVTITVNPSLWFMQGDGSVVDLTRYHCDPPQECPVPELEVEIEQEGGVVFTDIEWG